MNIDDIEEMRRVMLGEDNPLMDDVVQEVVEALEEIKASMEIETPIAEPVDKIKETLMENTENHLGSISAHDGSNSRMGVNEAIRTFTSQMIDKMAVKHFVGVQPLSGPVGIIYSLQYTQGEPDEEGERRCSLDIVSTAVEAGSRKLAYDLLLEPMMDAAEQHSNAVNIDPARDMAKEIYEEIRNDISHIAHKASCGMDGIMDDSLYFDQTKINMMEVSINMCANKIAQRTQRGAGNFMIVSETIAEILTHSKNFVPTSETDKDYGYVKYIGTLNGCIKIYCDFDLEYDKAIVGYKGGSGETDTGYIYAPYIQLMSCGVVVNPATFEPLIKFMTRYGKTSLQKNVESTSEDGLTTTTVREPSGYYVELTFDNLPKLDTIDFKEDEKEEKNVVDVTEAIFDEAMKILS